MKCWTNLETIIDEPNCLIAGVPGSGKSVLINSLLFNITAHRYSFCVIDLKRVELKRWSKSSCSCGSAVTPEGANRLLDGVIALMEKRYVEMENSMQTHYQGRRLYVVIDELADLMSYKGIEEKLLKIVRLGRAAEVHIIMATQDPSRRTISGRIQACITSAIALRCRSAIESRMIVKKSGAENLPDYGEGIFQDSRSHYYIIEVPLTPEEMIIERIKTS